MGQQEREFIRGRQMDMIANVSLLFACFSVALAVGGGMYESIVVMPQWSAQPPASFALIQKGTGIPLQAGEVFLLTSPFIERACIE
jgi:hypothetical protein